MIYFFYNPLLLIIILSHINQKYIMFSKYTFDIDEFLLTFDKNEFDKGFWYIIDY